jgi:hypothetical protein
MAGASPPRATSAWVGGLGGHMPGHGLQGAAVLAHRGVDPAALELEPAERRRT